ncbi:E3 ubiquitin protein ligase RIE1-like [Impatiens glandulifera]|uniref:E3 ubiquitin protein ligase RIE1-like n=1 Tax=Impatiens glandulifera TaxID=253017 RepID=UPI001FB05D63|nr:E3 ubiquitin protein ligase RIE1-like [Impatiens glandulifera]
MAETSEAESTAPLLRPRQGGDVGTGQAALAMLIGRATGRRGPSMLVRETAVMELEERRVDWGYSKPVVALDLTWNLAFVVVSVVMLIRTAQERPNVPIRVWIIGYMLQCLVHVVLVLVEYRRRIRRGIRVEDGSQIASQSSVNDSEEQMGGLGLSSQPSATKRLESLNTLVSFVWWVVGFYWVVAGGQILLQNSPCLYRLAVVFLAFDVFFAIFCIILACLIGVALCCCLPCIIAVLYAVAGQEGASDADLSILPKYKYEICSDGEKSSIGSGRMVPIETGSGYSVNERVLLPEDAECCICLNEYEDGTDLHALPCGHHFHAQCIVKWLKMNATCPLCKYNIVKGSEQV